MTDTFHVRVNREGDDYVAHVHDTNGKDLGSTWARSLRKLDEYAREVAVLGADLPDDATSSLTLTWEFDDSDLAAAAAVAEELADLRAREAQRVEALHAAMRKLTAAGYSTRDVAAVTGVTHGRVAQVVGGH